MVGSWEGRYQRCNLVIGVRSRAMMKTRTSWFSVSSCAMMKTRTSWFSVCHHNIRYYVLYITESKSVNETNGVYVWSSHWVWNTDDIKWSKWGRHVNYALSTTCGSGSGSVSTKLSAAYSALSVLLFSSTMYLSYRDKFWCTVVLVVLAYFETICVVFMSDIMSGREILFSH